MEGGIFRTGWILRIEPPNVQFIMHEIPSGGAIVCIEPRGAIARAWLVDSPSPTGCEGGREDRVAGGDAGARGALGIAAGPKPLASVPPFPPWVRPPRGLFG